MGQHRVHSPSATEKGAGEGEREKRKKQKKKKRLFFFLFFVFPFIAAKQKFPLPTKPEGCPFGSLVMARVARVVIFIVVRV